MADPENNRDQSQVEQAIIRPAPAGWGLKLLRALRLEKLIKPGS